ncbi:hypothetical protein FDB44_17515 [Clostridium botulinum]|uniref:hypothetical protein n=1 Tax=Clostridium botulinum TaxID=1491 RepID=UPI0013F13BC2|nr:hypothetical protein [Clostridium botulinum]MBY6935178.1 hypothetical protein [Clostridium botulinum]NFL84589.1 hypothetical protein [Clostridium botulinum]NFN12773.1 hypothetical protein [Clostridium botulinum]NFO38453.1 hypothetical protein [Clostridium botulinum]NFO44340.1 hypothetical protein [Clostridium botulinum]
MTIEQIEYELSKLSEKINLINDNVKFNIQILWGVLALIVAVLGMAIYFLVKQYIKSTLESQLEKQLKIMKKDFIKQYESENFSYEAPMMEVWEVLQSVVYSRNMHGYINIKGAIIAKDEPKYQKIIFCLPSGFRPKYKINALVMNGELNGECVVNTDGTVCFVKGNWRNIIQFDITYKQQEKDIKWFEEHSTQI